jgi:hypothetical protein
VQARELVGFVQNQLSPELRALVRMPEVQWGVAALLWLVLAYRFFGRTRGSSSGGWMTLLDWVIVGVVAGAVWLGFRDLRW